MVKRKHGVIVETPTEARQAEPGPSILIAACRQRKCRDGRYGRTLVRVLLYLVSDCF